MYRLIACRVSFALYRRARDLHHAIRVLMDRNQLAADRDGVVELIQLQVGRQKIAQSVGARVQIGDRFVEFGGLFGISQLET